MSADKNIDGGPESGSQPGDKNSESGKPKGDTFSKADLEDYAKRYAERKLRGAGGQIKDLEAKLAAFEEEDNKRKQAKMTLEEKLAATTSQLTELQAKLTAKEQAEQTELEAINEGNMKLIATFTDEQKALVPTEYPPKALEKWLRTFTSMQKTQVINVHGASGGDALTTEQKQAAHSDNLKKKASSFLFGDKAKN